jgi:hypothetical protein
MGSDRAHDRRGDALGRVAQVQAEQWLRASCR